MLAPCLVFLFWGCCPSNAQLDTHVCTCAFTRTSTQKRLHKHRGHMDVCVHAHKRTCIACRCLHVFCIHAVAPRNTGYSCGLMQPYKCVMLTGREAQRHSHPEHKLCLCCLLGLLHHLSGSYLVTKRVVTWMRPLRCASSTSAAR